MVLLFSLPIIEMLQKALKIRENYHLYEIFFVSLHRETIKQGTMTNRELIKKLLDFPMDMEVIIDNNIRHGKDMESKSVSYDDDYDKARILIANYD